MKTVRKTFSVRHIVTALCWSYHVRYFRHFSDKLFRYQHIFFVARYLVASRYVKQGELVLTDTPLVIGAQIRANHICFGCSTPLKHSLKICKACAVATVCSEECSGNARTIPIQASFTPTHSGNFKGAAIPRASASAWRRPRCAAGTFWATRRSWRRWGACCWGNTTSESGTSSWSWKPTWTPGRIPTFGKCTGCVLRRWWIWFLVELLEFKIGAGFCLVCWVSL